MDTVCSHVRRQLRRATTEKFDVECESVQPVPYIFLTPKGQDIDLRLFSRNAIRKALPILMGILERETRGWFLHFRERLISELREKKLTDIEIEEVFFILIFIYLFAVIINIYYLCIFNC